jgi:hypothetical protein
MNKKNINQDIIDIVSDVVVRFHEHDQYGTKEKAITALSKRIKTLSIQECTELFNTYQIILIKTIEAIIKSPKRNTGKYAGINDIDMIFVNEYLKNELPNQNITELKTFINWVIFWHYLK